MQEEFETLPGSEFPGEVEETKPAKAKGKGKGGKRKSAKSADESSAEEQEKKVEDAGARSLTKMRPKQRKFAKGL